MNQEKQPDAIELAARLETIAASGVNIFSSRLWMRKAATELQRLHALAETNRAEMVAEAARTAEEKLRADQMTKQHRIQCDISKSAVATLVGLGYTDKGGEQWAPPIGKAPDFNLLDAANAQIAELQAQLSAIGAGGVEALRKRDGLQQSTEPTRIEVCDTLLQAAHAFFASERAHGMHGAVKWLKGDDGSLVIFTRGEYKDRLMKAVGGDEDVPHAFDTGHPEPEAVAVPEALRELIEAIEFTPLGVRAIQAMTQARAALAAAPAHKGGQP